MSKHLTNLWEYLRQHPLVLIVLTILLYELLSLLLCALS